ncbi:phosphatase PAP2 family protein [Enterococcus sp. DIV0756]|uniref:phosphatase PAP2 family protein n=1 Tax=Enterococcus sp. DIV0756 TaxID=2774636 RepID=UPI003F1F6248
MKIAKKQLGIAIGLLIVFILYTICLINIDVQKIGPHYSEVGFATLNQSLYNKIGTNAFWCQVTEVLGIFPLIMVGYFALRGVFQLYTRKKLLLVDKEILALGFLYAGVAACYVLFEKVIINYRPILEDGQLEASYPSSHTFLAITVLLSAFYVLRKETGMVKAIIAYLSLVVMLVLVIGRFLSGSHWGTDIFGGVLLGLTLVSFYLAGLKAVLNTKKER